MTGDLTQDLSRRRRPARCAAPSTRRRAGAARISSADRPGRPVSAGSSTRSWRRRSPTSSTTRRSSARWPSLPGRWVTRRPLVGARDSLQNRSGDGAETGVAAGAREDDGSRPRRHPDLDALTAWMLIGVVAHPRDLDHQAHLARAPGRQRRIGRRPRQAAPATVAATDAPRRPPLPTTPLLPRRRIIGTHDRSRSFKARRARSG